MMPLAFKMTFVALHIISNFQPISETQMVKAVTVSVFDTALVFQLICLVLHIISHFQPIREGQMVNTITVSAFVMALVFQLICLMLHIVSNLLRIRDWLSPSLTMEFFCVTAPVTQRI
jgi:hypothetical protein